MKSNYCKTPTIFQMEATECGAASLAMICAYWGKHVPLEQMRVETGVSRDGCNAKNIMRAAKRFGMECHAYRKEPDALTELEMPCLIHWNFNHFVVLEGFKGDYVYLNDPAIGRRKLTMSELDEGFTGVVLTFKPTEAFEKVKKENTLFPLIKKRLNGQKEALTQLICIGLLLILPGLILPVLSQVFLDEILGAGNVPWFGQFLFFMAAVILFQTVLEAYRSRLLLKMQNKLVLLSAREFLERLFRLPVNFFDQRSAGDLVGRIENNDQVNEFITGGLAEIVLDIFVAVFYLILLLSYNPVMTLIGMFGIVFNMILTKITSEKISTMVQKLQQDKGKLAGAVCAGLSVTSTLKASGAESAYTARILGYEAKASSMEQTISRTQTIIGALPSVIGNLIDVVILIVGAMYVIHGQMTLGMLASFSTLFGSFSEPMEELVSFVQQIQTLKVNMERVDDIMHHPMDEAFDGHEIKEMPQAKLSGRVDLEEISFGYSRLAAPLVTDFSFSLMPGSSIAFVGSSGCGKSTVSKIVSGLYHPWSGSVKFDGVPMEQIPAEVLHASVSTVSQNITLFSGSIRDNITLWNPVILEKDMINAAKDACIHELITQKPGAYEFRLAEGGANLSGGQRQRLEIARALATNPTVLIMDEATSALDPITEKKIIDNIKRRGCTCIIVAHRLSAVRNSDEIIVMHAGEIVERGSHEELSMKNGYYCQFMANN